MTNKTDIVMKQEIREQVQTLFENACAHFLVGGVCPSVRFDIKGTHCFGQARYIENAVRFNFTVAKQNYEEFVKRTVPHEVAHIMQHKLSLRSKPHGYDWAKVMRFFGTPPDRCNSNYNMEGIAPARKTQKFAYKCNGCAKEYSVGKKVHNKIQNGSNYFCRKCRSRISYMGKILT